MTTAVRPLLTGSNSLQVRPHRSSSVDSRASPCGIRMHDDRLCPLPAEEASIRRRTEATRLPSQPHFTSYTYLPTTATTTPSTDFNDRTDTHLSGVGCVMRQQAFPFPRGGGRGRFPSAFTIPEAECTPIYDSPSVMAESLRSAIVDAHHKIILGAFAGGMGM